MGIVEMRFGDFILFEMAYSQNRAIEKIEDLLPQTLIHMFKCLTMSESQDFNHWLKEIENWLRQMNAFSNIKTGSGRISLKVFLKEFKWYFGYNTLKEYYENVVKRYNPDGMPEKDTINYVSSILYDIFESFSKDKYSWAVVEKKLRMFK